MKEYTFEEYEGRHKNNCGEIQVNCDTCTQPIKRKDILGHGDK